MNRGRIGRRPVLGIVEQVRDEPLLVPRRQHERDGLEAQVEDGLMVLFRHWEREVWRFPRLADGTGPGQVGMAMTETRHLFGSDM